jgi:pilus assembly protein CpaE
MTEQVTSVALIEPSLPNREALRGICQAIDWLVMEVECAQYEQAMMAFADTHFDGAIIGLDEDSVKALDVVAKLNQAHPDVTLAVISSRPDLLIQAHRLGARYLLEFPLQLEHLLGALRGLGAAHDANRPPKGQIVAIMSSRGGVGCTTLAANLACTLATLPDNQVILIDLDMIMGAADIALGLEPTNSLIDIALNIDQLGLHVLKTALARHDTGVSLLSRPTRYEELGHLHEEHVQRIVRLLQLLATHLIIDLSKGWLATDLQALHMADAILIVIQPDLASVRNAVLMLSALQSEGLDTKVFIVMNRCGAYFGKDSITIKKAEEVLGRLVYWQVPNDYKPMMEAWNSGVPLVKSAPNCRAQQSIAALAQSLCQRLNRTEVGKNGVKKTPTSVLKLPKGSAS